MNNKPPGHNWKSSESGRIIHCINCGQYMAFYDHLDPKETFDEGIFEHFNVAYPIINGWLMLGWALGDKHPTQPKNCQDKINEDNMEKALR